MNRLVRNTDKGYVYGRYTELYETLDGHKAVADKLGEIEDILCPDNATEITLDELREMCEAKREQRCVIMPCKVGDRIWTIENVFNGRETIQMIGSRIIDEIKHNKLNKNTMISKQPYEIHYYPSEIGKSIFLTRAEAESALVKEGEKQ